MALQAVKQTALVVGGANAVGFAITALFQTHKITDLVGVGSFVLATLQLSLTSLKSISFQHTNSWLHNRLFWINAGVMLWGTRLSSYLFHRILNTHEDKRLAKFFPQPGEKYLDRTKSNFPINLGMFWSIQALWGFICLLPVSMINSLPSLASSATAVSAINSLNIRHVQESITSAIVRHFSVKHLAGVIAPVLSASISWLPFVGIFLGITIESVADYQKTQYRSKKENDNHWCDVGLWSLSRYPNYFGEMLTWWSIYAASLPSLLKISSHPIYRWVPPAIGLLSPAFITFLLFKLSGIPLLEKKQQKQHGSNPDYQNYVRSTPLLIPWPKGFFAALPTHQTKKTD